MPSVPPKLDDQLADGVSQSKSDLQIQFVIPCHHCVIGAGRWRGRFREATFSCVWYQDFPTIVWVL